MTMTRTEAWTIEHVIERLQCEPVRWSDGSLQPGESDAVRAALMSPEVRTYLDTWVITALALLLPGPDRDPALALQVARH